MRIFVFLTNLYIGFGINYASYRFKTEYSNRAYEIDFLMIKIKKLVPIEVKSSNYRRHTSFDYFINKYSSRAGEKYIIFRKYKVEFI